MSPRERMAAIRERADKQGRNDFVGRASKKVVDDRRWLLIYAERLTEAAEQSLDLHKFTAQQGVERLRAVLHGDDT